MAPNQNIDTLLEQYNLLLRIGVKPVEGEDHIICHRPRDQNKVADALAGAASEGSLGLVWGWDFAALRALGRVWGEGGSHWVVRGFCDGSYLKATEAAPARAGAGGQIIVQVFDKWQNCLIQSQIFQFGVQMQPEEGGSYDAEARALEILMNQLGILFEQVVRRDAAA